MNLPSEPQARKYGWCFAVGPHPSALTNAAVKLKANYNYRLEPRPLPDQACPFHSPVDYLQHFSVLGALPPTPSPHSRSSSEEPPSIFHASVEGKTPGKTEIFTTPEHQSEIHFAHVDGLMSLLSQAGVIKLFLQTNSGLCAGDTPHNAGSGMEGQVNPEAPRAWGCEDA